MISWRDYAYTYSWAVETSDDALTWTPVPEATGSLHTAEEPSLIGRRALDQLATMPSTKWIRAHVWKGEPATGSTAVSTTTRCLRLGTQPRDQPPQQPLVPWPTPQLTPAHNDGDD